MRNVCRPGSVACPRIFMISILRTTELRSTLWRSQIRPSATVKTGFGSFSLKYSPMRKVVACQLVISMPSCCTNSCRPMNDLPLSCASTTERNESTKTRPGPCCSTSATMRASTFSRSPDAVSSDRLTNRTQPLILSLSKNSNCCW